MVNKVVYHLRDIKRGDIIVFDGKDNYPDEAPVEPSRPTRSAGSCTTSPTSSG